MLVGGVIVVSAGAFAPIVYCVSPLTTITNIYNFHLCKGPFLWYNHRKRKGDSI